MNRQKVLPPVWFLLSIMSMIGLHLWLPVKQLIFPPLTYLGVVASAMGIGIALFCTYYFSLVGEVGRSPVLPLHGIMRSSELITRNLSNVGSTFHQYHESTSTSFSFASRFYFNQLINILNSIECQSFENYIPYNKPKNQKGINKNNNAEMLSPYCYFQKKQT